MTDVEVQLKPKENVDGKPGSHNSSVVSKLVCSLTLLVLFPLPLFFFDFGSIIP